MKQMHMSSDHTILKVGTWELGNFFISIEKFKFLIFQRSHLYVPMLVHFFHSTLIFSSCDFLSLFSLNNAVP